MKWGRNFLPCVLIILTLLGLGELTEGGEDELFQKIGVKQIKEERKAPNFCLEGLNRKKIELRSFKGKVVFLNFWATWCGPCKEEMPSMDALYQQFKDKDFVFLTICVDYGGPKPVKEFIERHRYVFPVLLDPKFEILDLYEVKGIPTTFVIDKRGLMVGKAIGPRNWNSQEVKSLLNLLIAK